MPRRTEAQRARRASVRQMLKDASFTQIGRMYNAGKISLSDLRTFYSDVRSDYMRQIKRVEKSDVSFINRPEELPTARELKNPEDFIKGIADANRFIQSKSMSTVTGRRKVRDKAIATLHKRGIDVVNKENYNLWVRFQKWYDNAAKQYGYGSDSPEIVELFEQAEEKGADDSTAWAALFDKYIAGDV